MPTALNLTLLPSPNPKFLIMERSFITSPASVNLFVRVASSLSRTLAVVRCSNSESEGREINGFKESLSGMVGKRVEELMNREENKGLLEGLEEASQRVERAQKELAKIQMQENEATMLRNYVDQLENRASEIAGCQTEILEARTMVKEAEHSLLLDTDRIGDQDVSVEQKREETDKDEERWESIKAAFVSALTGTLVGLPISLTQVTSSPQLVLPLAVTFISCALFGVTFRYAIRRDLDNVQLKTGTSAAFGFVKGLATLAGGPPLELDAGSFLSHAFDVKELWERIPLPSSFICNDFFPHHCKFIETRLQLQA
ncbi:uncharacterized protein LOC131164725 isoform X2 [Malania oleifera]|uniref:uncharacterized protein LOC131164725 isoform X2 n=1 Tax=Malania oleifera TaxID=397392 RepID=UPI0025ADDF46|nr:uncharacterized protein LOC131164725 isoform X2 [Malania oleifera]